MIRFACPGCSATFSVDDAKAGKQSKCPKCRAEFVIPSAEAAPPPLPESTAAAEPVEIDPCFKCGTRVTVLPKDVGSKVECPSCASIFTATTPGTKVPAPPPAPPKKSALESTDGDGRPRTGSRRRDDDDRPSKRRPRDEDDDDRPSSRRRRDDDDCDDDYDDDDRPSRRGRRRNRPDQITSIAIMLVVGGGIAILSAAAIVLLSGCLGLLWPGVYLALVCGIMALIRGVGMFNEPAGGGVPRAIFVMQIILILNCDVINLALGIIGFVLAGDPRARDYLER